MYSTYAIYRETLKYKYNKETFRKIFLVKSIMEQISLFMLEDLCV